MDNWDYKVSVIVPVYKAEKWLKCCINSLLTQTIPLEDMEILLIDNGSPDGCGVICDAYATLYPDTVKVWHIEENVGVSPARNVGIRHANGKYLMYLDSDDQLAPETVKACVDFFDRHYNEVDLVTYREVYYRDGKQTFIHFRYQYLTKTGIYDLQEYPYLSQSRLNICVKNMREAQQFFDELKKDVHEDQDYCVRLLSEKMMIGFVDKGEYLYNKDNENSAMAAYYTPVNLFYITLSWQEDMFSKYKDKVPPYIQAQFFYNCSWRLRDNIFFPYHLDKHEYNAAIMRLRLLFNRVDVETLMNHPAIDSFHKHFWLSFKENATVAILGDSDALRLMHDGKTIYQRKYMEIVPTRCEVRNDRLDFIAFLKSPFYNYIEDNAEIYIIENGDMSKPVKMKVNLAAESMYRCRTQTNRFFQFRYQCDIRKSFSFEIMVAFDEKFYRTSFYFHWTVAFNSKLKRYSYMSENTNISLKDSVFYLSKAEMVNEKNERIWLYADVAHVKMDNGYYQFAHDLPKNDGVLRYYITSVPENEWRSIYQSEQFPHMVIRNSKKHRELYIKAEKVLAAYHQSDGAVAHSPFTRAEAQSIRDKLQAEIIYLQHAHLHASYVWLYALERNIAHKIVVSSQFEYDNYIKHYHYDSEDLIAAGMARYDNININKKGLNKILYAPSWRSYTALRDYDGNWLLNKERFIESNFYKGIYAFISSSKLQKLLEEFDYTLDIKLHPIMTEGSELFVSNSNRVNVVGDVEIEDYSVFATDFSSFAFEYVYLKRPIFYFVPDYLEFRSGMAQYRELDLEFDDAFGDLAITAEAAVDALDRILQNNCKPEEKYLERMDGWFFHYDGKCRERLYKYLTEGKL